MSQGTIQMLACSVSGTLYSLRVSDVSFYAAYDNGLPAAFAMALFAKPCFINSNHAREQFAAIWR
jgi:hypothetical protein